ncbi:MAG: hypothetical protein WAU49_20630 [Steroidobacteraceae bacterium]
MASKLGGWAVRNQVLAVSQVKPFALVQMIVHFRFFMHIRLNGRREDLQLILFSTAVLIIMVGGTVWIMGSLALRMGMR